MLLPYLSKRHVFVKHAFGAIVIILKVHSVAFCCFDNLVWIEYFPLFGIHVPHVSVRKAPVEPNGSVCLIH